MSPVTSPSSASAAPPPVSDHFDGKIFFNPTLPPAPHEGLRDIFKMLSEKREKWPVEVLNTARPDLHAALQPDDVALTFVNHATFLIQCNGLNILTDPVWSKRVGPVSWLGPARVRPPGIPFTELPPIHAVLISHNHFDHLDPATLKRINARFSPAYFAPWGNRKLLQRTGAKEIVEFDWWQTLDHSSGLGITFAPAQHWSKRGLFDRQKSLWGSFMVTSGTRRIFFGGDSGYCRHFTDIRQRLGAPDLALLSMGAYEPRWFMQDMHMNPAEAVAAHRDLEARHSVGMHFGTFHLSAEGIDQPRRDLQAALAAAGLSDAAFTTLETGETRIYRAAE